MIRPGTRFWLVFLVCVTRLGAEPGPIISEFMAQSDGGLRDAEGESPDWIEIFNPSGSPLDLQGWHLTDDASNLAQWTFPATVIPPGGYLMVFASGKDRVFAGGELHTNFALANDGELLALVEPDGITIAHAYAPGFPRQRANVSFGIEGSEPVAFELDFNDQSSAESGAADSEIGFNTMNLTQNPASFDGVTVTLSALGGATLDDRDRSLPQETATLTQDQLYDDFLFAPGAVDGYGIQVLLAGLKPDQDYLLTVWSGDPQGSTEGPRTSDWIETAGGTTNILATGYVWDVEHPATQDGDNTFSSPVRSSPEGMLRIEGRRNGGVSSGVYLNALQLVETGGTDTGERIARYFTPATPGTVNGAGFDGLVAEPVFSVERGFYEEPFTVSLSTPTAGAEIRWTRDGTEPTETNGTLYSEPISITGFTALRAAAFLPGHVPSLSVTHSYIFLDEILQQPANPPGYPAIWQANYPADYEMDPNVTTHAVYGPTLRDDLRSIPTLSIVADHDAFWHPVTGIYVDATKREDRAVSVELIDGDGSSRFQVNAAVRMQGNASRDNNRLAKHSFRLKFTADYGPSKLRHDWFPGPVDSFDNIVLRGCFTDAWGTRYSDQTTIPGGRGIRYRPEDSLYLRDIWVKDSMAEMGHLSGRGSFVHLYVNGLYWGLYNPTERLDASFFSHHVGGNEADWDIIRDFSEVLDGSIDEWNNLITLVNAGITSEAAYEAVAERVDLENLIDYMLLHIFAEAEDWPSHNWYAARRRANPVTGLPATRWIFLPWDQEIVLDQLVQRNRINVSNDKTPARVYSQLRAWPEFRRLFGDRVHKHLFNGGALTPQINIRRFLARATEIDRAVVGESARWGDAREVTIGDNPGHGQTFTRDEWWRPELQKLYGQLFQSLTETNIARFRAGNLYPDLGAPVIRPFGGLVPAGLQVPIGHNNETGTIHYTTDGTDPRQEGTGAVAATALTYEEPLTINAVTRLHARVLSGAEWSALVETTFYPAQDLIALALTEVMYNPPALGETSGNDLEFLEFKNRGTSTLDLSGLTFSEGIAFTFPHGTFLEPGAFYVLARNPAALAAKYPGLSADGTYTGQLGNGGETVTLSHALGAAVFSFTYDDQAPWPVTPDGHGFSLVPKYPDPEYLLDEGAAWRASFAPGGSPGADDPAPVFPLIVINEILAHTDPPQSDSIELHNPGLENVNLGGWYLTDDAATPRKYRIPGRTILAGGGYLVFNEGDFNVPSDGGVPFAFSSAGEEAYLFSADAGELTGYSHGVVFGASFNGMSIGRHLNSVGEEQFPRQLAFTPAAANAGPRVGPIVINEIHYHPAGADDEFLELLNTSDSPMPLFDPAHPVNTWMVNGLSFTFPPEIVMSPGELLLLVAGDPEAFRAKYQVATAVRILGPLPGRLDNSGERLSLQAPDGPNVDLVPYVTVEAVRYGDRAPWPSAADGTGASLHRIFASAHGDDPANWTAAAPTPGLVHDPDSDGDGLPDWWELTYGMNPKLPDAEDDPDRDGFTNREELLAGTVPNDPASYLKVALVRADSDALALQFLAVANRTYTILYKDSLSDPSWTKLADLEARETDRIETIADPRANLSRRFYRLVTPRLSE